MTTPRIWINGRFYDKADARVSVYDHGLLYGDGVFEGIRVYNGKVFLHRQHIERLFESARAILLEFPGTVESIMDAVNATVAENKKVDGYIRLVVTRGAGSLGLDPRGCEPQIIVIVDDIRLYPEELYQDGMKVITSSYIRNHPNALSPRIKSLNYLNNIMAKMEAIRAGCLEAVMLNHKGEVAECTGDNIFIVRRGVVKTPPVDSGILEGVTRNVVIDLARSAGLEVREENMTRHDLFVADEMFLTGTAAELIAVTDVDGRRIGSGKQGPITKRLREAFTAFARR